MYWIKILNIITQARILVGWMVGGTEMIQIYLDDINEFVATKIKKCPIPNNRWKQNMHIYS